MNSWDINSDANALNRQAASRGDSVSDSSDAIWRGILIEICRYFVKSSYQNGYLWRVVFVTLYLVIGRAGEAATATWDSMCWNTTLKCPEMNWVEIKTGKVLPVQFVIKKTGKCIGGIVLFVIQCLMVLGHMTSPVDRCLMVKTFCSPMY